MDSTFTNQLNEKEIRQGILAYISQKWWWFPAAFVMTSGFYLIDRGVSPWAAAVLSFGIGLLAIVFLFILWRRQFSPEKVAVYHLGEDFLTITNSAGIDYTYSRIKTAILADVVVLFLPKGGFAIVAKGCMTEAQLGALLQKR